MLDWQLAFSSLDDPARPRETLSALVKICQVLGPIDSAV